MVNAQTWSDHLDPPLVQRLWRPVAQPGAMDGRMVERLFNRYYQFVPPTPLLEQCLTRQAHLTQAELGAVPIVYAQPWENRQDISGRTDGNLEYETTVESFPDAAVNPAPVVSPRVFSSQSTIIQAKLDPAARSATPLKDNQPIELPQLPQISQPSDSAPIVQSKLESRSQALPIVKATQGPISDQLLAPLKPAVQSADPLSTDAFSTLDSRLPLVVAVSPPRQTSVSVSASAIASPTMPPVVQPLPLKATPTLAPPQLSAMFALPLARGAARSVNSGQDAIRDAISPRSAPNISSSMTLPVVSGQPVEERSQASSPALSPPAVDMAQLTDQVERRLRRKLVVERERRGWYQR